jgi:predicted phage baseplate assembly protein
MVSDETAGFRHSGLVSFLPLRGFAPRTEFGSDRYWMRMRREGLKLGPRLQDVLLNTTTAVHGISFQNEILGSGTEKPGQRFKTTHAPVLAGQQLEVREPVLPPVAEQARIVQEEGTDALKEVAGQDKNNFWIRWHAVPNFYGSGPRDRHYMLDPLTGEIIFGNGSQGLVPPRLAANIRMASYRSGGGSHGNKAALTITQLKSPVPYVDKVINWEAADGGGNAEPVPALLQRAPLGLRHQNRAVTVEDFEDLVVLGFKEVARAKCVPLYDLESKGIPQVQPGVLSLIVVPHSSDARPAPSVELLSQVRAFLDERRTSPATLILVGPRYVSVDVETEVAVERPEIALDVETAVTSVLRGYLHPVTGGHGQAGWQFGRVPHKSELYACIEAVSGVNHVRNLQITVHGDKSELALGWFLICCGSIQVRIGQLIH